MFAVCVDTQRGELLANGWFATDCIHGQGPAAFWQLVFCQAIIRHQSLDLDQNLVMQLFETWLSFAGIATFQRFVEEKIAPFLLHNLHHHPLLLAVGPDLQADNDWERIPLKSALLDGLANISEGYFC